MYENVMNLVNLLKNLRNTCTMWLLKHSIRSVDFLNALPHLYKFEYNDKLANNKHDQFVHEPQLKHHLLNGLDTNQYLVWVAVDVVVVVVVGVVVVGVVVGVVVFLFILIVFQIFEKFVKAYLLQIFGLPRLQGLTDRLATATKLLIFSVKGKRSRLLRGIQRLPDETAPHQGKQATMASSCS
uniref:Uncharacterized protein n=1 Tax=Glossina brevipalpis TaxID=37001 RepID=A0A1A9WS32_9MUSC